MWIYPTVLLCLYGFFKEMKPSEPFLTPYLRTRPNNFTDEQLENEIYPVWTYSFLVALFVVFFVTDFLRYKPVIIIEALAYLATRILLIWGTSVVSMQVMQVSYGIATGAEAAYYSYIYASVASEYYQKVTSYTRAAILVGRMASGVFGQLLVSLSPAEDTEDMYLTLNYISLGSVLVSLVLSLVLPRVPTKDRGLNPSVQTDVEQVTTSKLNQLCLAWKAYLMDFLQGFKRCYSRNVLLRWSLWWAVATCGEYQVENYVQNLWDTIQPSHRHMKVYNGGVTAVAHFFAASVAFALAFPRINWTIWGELCLAFFSIVDCFLLFIMAGTKNVWVAYGCYVLFRIIYTFLITIASLQIAKVTDKNRFGLVFGCNMFASLVLQTILTSILTSKSALGLHAKKQFIVYGFYFYLIGAVFLAMAVYTMTRIGWRACWHRRYLPVPAEPKSEENESVDSESVTPL